MMGRVELVHFMYLNVKFNTSKWGIILYMIQYKRCSEVSIDVVYEAF